MQMMPWHAATDTGEFQSLMKSLKTIEKATDNGGDTTSDEDNDNEDDVDVALTSSAHYSATAQLLQSGVTGKDGCPGGMRERCGRGWRTLNGR